MISYRACILIATTICNLVAIDLRGAEPVGQLIFQDDFEREETVTGQEEIGNDWRTNSAWRAAGQQQVDLDRGAMHIYRHPGADHGVAVFHDAEFADAMIEMRFRLSQGDDLGLDFVDRELKTVHAGHLGMARVNLNSVTLMDSKTGHMDLKIRERRQAGDNSPELKKFIATKQHKVPLKLKADHWYTLKIRVQNDVLTAWIDDELVAEFQSAGFAHPTKRMITLAVNKSAWVDDFKIWKLK